jgi:DNA-binding CsgD family transcriptional regulator
VTRTEVDLQAYVHHLEEHLRLTVFGCGVPGAEGAILLVRGALAADDRPRAVDLAAATARLAALRPADRDMAAASSHARGLVEQEPAALEWAAQKYSAPPGRAWATEDAGTAWGEQGDRAMAVARLHAAHALYQQLGDTDSLARVRARLRATGVRVRHWRRSDRPAFGWESLTETERRVALLVAQGLTNRQIASRMCLSTYTIAFHLRRVFCKLDLTSRVQLASLAAERGKQASGGQLPPQAPSEPCPVDGSAVAGPGVAQVRG